MEKQKDLKKIVDKALKENREVKEIDNIKAYIKQLEDEVAELQEGVQRQVADLRNTVKRRDEVESNLRKYSSQKLGEMIIPDIDLFKKVIKSSEAIDNAELSNYLQGFKMIVTKMDNTLNEVGIKEFVVELGSEFDPSKQEAVEHVETEEFKSGQIVSVVSNGYMIYDKVLMHAKVKVAK